MVLKIAHASYREPRFGHDLRTDESAETFRLLIRRLLATVWHQRSADGHLVAHLNKMQGLASDLFFPNDF
jgi:hypothetical protein